MGESKNASELVASLYDPAVRALAGLGRIRSYPKQTVVISEGDAGDTVFVILSGRVRVFSSDEKGRQVILDILHPGELVGEMALDGSRRSASAMTIEPTVLSVLEAAALRERLKADPALAMMLVTGLLGRLRRTTGVVKSLALGDVYERLAAVLRDLFASSSTGATIEGLTQQDLADRIGSSRDMVNRIFRELEKGGYIELARRKITLLKPLPARW